MDAVVRNAANTFVPNLTAGDFEVFESGRRQQIETFYLVDPAAAGASHTPVLSAVPGSRAPAMSASVPQHAFLVWLDLPHMSPGSFVRAQRAVSTFFKTALGDGDAGGIIAGGTVIGGRLTNSKHELSQSVESIRIPSESRSAALDMREWPRLTSLYEAFRVDVGDELVISRVIARACADDAERCRLVRGEDAVRHLVVVKGRTITSEARNSARRTLASLEALANRLGTLPGRKTLIYLSDGFLSEDLSTQVQGVVGRAARAAVRIHAVDTRGLDRISPSNDLLAAPPQERTVVSRDVPAELPQFDIAADGPNSLAVDTGGIMFRNENDLGEVLREVVEDTSRYYVLGYRPDRALDGAFRHIQVRVKPPGLTVRARRGYLAAPAVVASPVPNALVEVTDGAGSPAGPTPSEPLQATPLATASLVPLSEAQSRPDGSPLPADPNSIRLRPHAETGKADAARLRDAPAEAKGAESLPADLAGQAREGWSAYERGDTKTARACLTAAAAHPSAPVWVAYVLGWSAFAENDVAAARQQWERVRAAVPEFEPVYFNLADTYLREQKRPDALVMLMQAARRWPDHAEVHNALGVVYTSMGRLAEGIPAFSRAVAAAPGDPTGHFNLARASEIAFVNGITGSAAGDPAGLAALRDRAGSEYRRVVEFGGTLAGAARSGLRRLEPLDASRLQVSNPKEWLRSGEDALGGTAARLVWSPDGSRLCLRTVRMDNRGVVTSDSLRSISMDGRVEVLDGVPDWAASYWTWKSAVSAPWRAEVRLAVQDRKISLIPENLNPHAQKGATSRDYSRQPKQTSVTIYLAHGEEIGAEIDALITRGATFSWSPFAMGALVYVDRRSALSILDTAGRRCDVPGSRNALLPAWSPDGTRIAFLVRDRGLRLMVAEVSGG